MSAAKSNRPASLEEAERVLQNLVSQEGAKRGLDLQLQPSDIVISPFSKCGTTWLQQMVHTLRTRGDMDFDDISRVVPWIEVSHDLGLDLEAPQRGTPRAFKSHLCWHKVPKGGRYIVSFRDPKDALLSQFRFLEGWFFETGAIGIEEWARARYLADPKQGYWHHLVSWWSQRDNPKVLLLCFEDMKEDLPGTIERVAHFTGVALDAGLRDTALQHASFAFMKARGDRFDDRMMRERSERVCGLPTGSDSTKVRVGRVGEHRKGVPAPILAELDRVWAREIEANLGFASYDEFRAAVGELR